MSLSSKTATIFGGTGFIGTQVVRELAAKGLRIKVATRVPERAYFLRPAGVVGQIVPFACDYSEESIAEAVKGSDYVVNCIGILYEKGKRQTFQKAHIDIPELIAKACKTQKVDSFVHISALACDRGSSKYAKSKLAGEEAVHKNYKGTVILRPSVVFGENDEFFNMFARMTQILPPFAPFPLIGGGKTKFQPVFVGDVADAVMAGLFKKEIAGQIYELGGPDVVTFKEVYEILFDHIKLRQPLMNVPFFLGKIQGAIFGLMPKPLLTADQVESLKTDTIVSEGAKGLKDLGVKPTAMDLILPTYLDYYRPGGRFADVPKQA